MKISNFLGLILRVIYVPHTNTLQSLASILNHPCEGNKFIPFGMMPNAIRISYSLKTFKFESDSFRLLLMSPHSLYSKNTQFSTVDLYLKAVHVQVVQALKIWPPAKKPDTATRSVRKFRTASMNCE